MQKSQGEREKEKGARRRRRRKTKPHYFMQNLYVVLQGTPNLSLPGVSMQVYLLTIMLNIYVPSACWPLAHYFCSFQVTVACVVDTLKLLYRVSGKQCTISCSNPRESQGHMQVFLIGQFLMQFVISPTSNNQCSQANYDSKCMTV